MATTATKTISFDHAIKQFSKYVSRKESRPVLKYVYNDGKNLIATDSHVLLRMNKDYITDIPEFTLYDPKNMRIVNEQYNYPDCSRLIPTYYNSTVIIDENIKEFQQHIKEIKKVVKKNINHVMKMEFKHNETWVSGDNYEKDEAYKEYFAKLNSMRTDGEEITLHINANYLDTAIDTIKKLSKLSHNDIQLGLNGHMRPIHFKQEDVFDLIVLPIRMY